MRRARLAAIVQGIDLPEGFSFTDQAAQQGLNEDLAGLIFATSLSVVFIYLLMGLLFESFILPLSIIFTIPLAGFGVVWCGSTSCLASISISLVRLASCCWWESWSTMASCLSTMSIGCGEPAWIERMLCCYRQIVVSARS